MALLGGHGSQVRVLSPGVSAIAVHALWAAESQAWALPDAPRAAVPPQVAAAADAKRRDASRRAAQKAARGDAAPPATIASRTAPANLNLSDSFTRLLISSSFIASGLICAHAHRSFVGRRRHCRTSSIGAPSREPRTRGTQRALRGTLRAVVQGAIPAASASSVLGAGGALGVSPDASGRQLLRWLEEEGAAVSPALDVGAPDALLGRELVVTEDVAAGEDLIRLTPELCIPAAAREDLAPLNLSEDVLLAVILLEAADLPRWAAYRAVWPSQADLMERLPVFWSPSRLSSGPFQALSSSAQARRRSLRSAAERLGIDPERLTWAHALVSTRAVGASINACALIPGVDLANHSSTPNADLVVAGEPGIRTGRATVTTYRKVWEHGSAGLVAKRDLVAGEAVRISYGSYPNQRLLLDYGFSLGSANPAGDLEETS
ncbi:unnamed protein product [Polarella glacialis]|uniref:SET domain-containing protein n=1 Tax=Polarella glacialis TaxID=89957 RepID=A0A813LTM3_POLGL|nr:unnamed protein product [Polarella glacialis]